MRMHTLLSVRAPTDWVQFLASLFGAAALALIASGCTTTRPCGTVCAQAQQEATQPAASKAPFLPYRIRLEREADHALIEAFRPLVRRHHRQERTIQEREECGRYETVDLLALSSGGVYGAYGAGFLVGWSKRNASLGDARPIFDIVTGVSTGAILAPFAFLGSSYDASLQLEYGTNGLSDAELVRKRSVLALLSADSLYSVNGIRALLEHYIDDAFIDKVAVESEKCGRGLFVGATSLDSGEFTIFDLAALARKKDLPDRRKLFIDAILAAAAIPIVFPPVFIDGEMFVDGGVREHVFVPLLAKYYRLAAEAEGVTLPPRTLYMFLNSDLAVPATCTGHGLITIGGRSFNVIVDQLFKESSFRLAYAAQVEGLRLKAVDAANLPCPRKSDSNDVFDADFSRCLFSHAAERAQQPDIAWKTQLQDIYGEFATPQRWKWGTGTIVNSCKP